MGCRCAFCEQRHLPRVGEGDGAGAVDGLGAGEAGGFGAGGRAPGLALAVAAGVGCDAGNCILTLPIALKSSVTVL